MNNISLGLLLSLLLASCCKAIFEESYVIKNDSSHSVQINRIRDNKIISTLSIPPSSSSTAAFYSVETGDSTMIIFDNSVSCIHYSSAVKDLNNYTKVIQINDSRNIYNRNNYAIAKKELSCNGSSTTYTYRLTDQDYYDLID